MSGARNRSRTAIRVSGGRWANNNPTVIIGAGPMTADVSTCADVTGFGDCAPFTVNGRRSDGGVIIKRSTGTFSSQFDNYICDWIRTTGNGPHLTVPGIPSDVDAATKAAARTNPSAPYVDVPVNALDVRPGIQTIRDNGYRVIQRVRQTGGRWLNWSFMIQPLVGDLLKLAGSQQQVARRVAAINKLYEGHGIRKTVDIFFGSQQSSYNAAVQSAGTLINRTIDAQTIVLKRCHIRWRPDRVSIKPTPDVIHAWARQSVQGGTLDFATLWEITPWSWLLDYFGEVGTFLKASRNIVPAHVSGVHPMTHTKTKHSFSGTTIADGSISGGYIIRETKTRSTSFVAPTAHLNFLSGSQLGVLAALGATKARF